ncbi:hypothetical protein CONLIGDRAFT_667319 [Coniochaeta ligniaria NRRL 30616]|uniref:Single-strand DNA deaminase toxin A-like C-terminal domain-containing protein n=1 Tax=Coniochaeta ligniaria NRRL 30616 TaxID=1408157 RepID=A0A1J7JXI4_9PEZI|nr:hypothetical protein CONLIGDRAFT_667319 [Coniochaeta ligniaria NRRL 30616]
MTRLRLDRIHEAVLDNDLPRVRKLLHRKPSDVDKQDRRGATPLILAALMRSPKMVTFLLEKRARWEITDRAGHTASDYIQDPFAEEMRHRYKRFMRAHRPKSPKQKRAIQDHLNDVPALTTQYRTKAAGTLCFHRRNNSLRIHKLIAKVKFAGPIKNNTTAACIAAGNTIRPLKCAVSGWSRGVRNDDLVLDGAKYTEVVREMSRILDFDLPRHCYDTPGGGSLGKNVGRFYASHCEKLLAAYWVVEQLKFAFGSEDLGRMGDLKAFLLPAHRRKATLYIDQRPCIPCRLFLASIQNATNIKICAFPQARVQEVSRGKRNNTCKNCSCIKGKIARKTTKTSRPPQGRTRKRFPPATPDIGEITLGKTNPLEDETDEPVSSASSPAAQRQKRRQQLNLMPPAHFEVVLQRIPQDVRQEFKRVTPALSHQSLPSISGGHAADSPHSRQSSIVQQRQAIKGQRLARILSGLQLREMFALRERTPPARPRLADRVKNLKQSPTIRKTKRSRTALRSQRPHSQRPKDHRMASRSTLLQNVKYRKTLGR